MKIDEILPEYDYVESHELFVPAPPERVHEVMKNIDFSESTMVRILMSIRGARSSIEASTMRDAFTLLYNDPPNEIVLGLIGKPWKIKGELLKLNAAQYQNFNEIDYVKIAWNFTFAPLPGGTMLATETRIRCMDKGSKRKFGIYWFFIQPFSALVRKQMLQLIYKKSLT